MRMKNNKGVYSNFLLQNYLFFSTTPRKTVYFLKVHTNIDWCKKTICKHHYYYGDDLSLFRYPDSKILEKGSPFSAREFEIIKLIEKGLSSQEIAAELFLSVNTVNTHRSNILSKSNKSHISYVIYDLKEQGVL